MRKKVSVLLVAAMLLLAMAWPALADTINLTVTPLDATTAFAIDASNPPPSNLGVLKGSYGQFSVTVKNTATQTLNLYIKGYDAVPSGSDSAWTLEEISPTSPPTGGYGVVAKSSLVTEYSAVTKSGFKVYSGVSPNDTHTVDIKIYLPATVNTSAQQVQIDLYGSTS